MQRGNVNLIPNDKDIEDRFKGVFKYMIESIVDAPRFISMFHKKDYEAIFNNDLMNKDNINMNDNERALIKTNDSLDEQIKANFKEIIEKSKYFKKFTEAIYGKVAKNYRDAP